MPITLKILSGSAAGRRIALSAGQVAQFGRTEWADFSFPQDGQMADVQFAIESRPDGCRVRDLTGRSATLLNGAPVTEAVLHSGDELRAGQTVFAVQVDGEPPRTSAPAPTQSTAAGAPPSAETDAPPGSRAADLCAHFELEDEARGLLQPNQTPHEFLTVLTAGKQFRDAVRLNAHWLPKREAVWWGGRCLRRLSGESLSDADRAALDAAERWAADPTEDHRRQAESAAEALGFRTPASWLSAAAFWSGGSLAPPGLGEVPPAAHLTGTAVSAALLLLAAPLPPHRIAETFQTFLALADAVRAGQDRWPER